MTPSEWLVVSLITDWFALGAMCGFVVFVTNARRNMRMRGILWFGGLTVLGVLSFALVHYLHSDSAQGPRT